MNPSVLCHQSFKHGAISPTLRTVADELKQGTFEPPQFLYFCLDFRQVFLPNLGRRLTSVARFLCQCFQGNRMLN